jgi:Flp pilus assembly pilin Flp
MLKNFWVDEAGAALSAELVLIITIAVIGLVTGLSSLRDAVVTELADVGAAIGSVDQTYTVGGIVAHSSAVTAFGYTDAVDYCDNGTVTTAARCVEINSGSLDGGDLSQTDSNSNS